MYRCVTPGHQFESIYRHGEFDNCRSLGAAMWACMRGGEARRLADEAAAAAPDAAPAGPAAHPVWPLKATPRWEYEAEAEAPPRARGIFRKLTKE